MPSKDRFFARHVQESLIGNFVWTIAMAAITLLVGSPKLLVLLLVGSLFPVFAFKGVSALRQRLRQPDIHPTENALKVPRRGVIFTLSLRSADKDSVVHQVVDSLRGIPSEVKPELFGFLGTPQTEQAKVVATLCKDLSIPEEKFKSEMCEPTYVYEGKSKTALIIDWMLRQGLNEKDIVLDLTGGTATMSVAAFIAADEKRIDSQYIYSEFDREKNQIKPGSQKQILITRYWMPEEQSSGESQRSLPSTTD